MRLLGRKTICRWLVVACTPLAVGQGLALSEGKSTQGPVPSRTAADPRKQALIRPTKQLIWGFSEYPPFKYVENGEHKGIDLLLMREVASRMQLDLQIVDCPLKRCLALMQSGQIDVVTALGLRPERQQFIHFIRPPYNVDNRKAFYIRQGSPVQIDRWEDIYRYVIGVKNGAGYSPRFDSDPKIRKEGVDAVEQNLRKLAQGRLDVVINTEIQFEFLALKMGLDGKFAKTQFAVESGQDYIGLAKKSPLSQRRLEMQRIVQTLVAGGYMRQIRDQFFAMVRREVAADFAVPPSPANAHSQEVPDPITLRDAP